MRASVRVDGLETVARALDAVGDAAADPAPALRETAEYGAKQVAQRAPRRTGRLAGSARPVVEPGGVAVEVTAPYAPFQNFGTRFIDAANFLGGAEPAVEAFGVRAVDEHLSTTIRQRGIA